MNETGTEHQQSRPFFTSIADLLRRLFRSQPTSSSPKTGDTNWSQYNSFPKSPVQERAEQKQLGYKDLTNSKN